MTEQATTEVEGKAADEDASPSLAELVAKHAAVSRALAAHPDVPRPIAAFMLYATARLEASLTDAPEPRNPAVDYAEHAPAQTWERAAELVAPAPTGVPTAPSPPVGTVVHEITAPTPAPPVETPSEPSSAGDILAELELVPAPAMIEPCGALLVQNGRAFADSPCQLPAGHADAPGHRNQNIGWWR